MNKRTQPNTTVPTHRVGVRGPSVSIFRISGYFWRRLSASISSTYPRDVSNLGTKQKLMDNYRSGINRRQNCNVQVRLECQ